VDRTHWSAHRAPTGWRTALIAGDYFIQLTVVQPSVLQGKVDGLLLWSQYNPHGIFIALEASATC
jgi:hypothetical protein